MIHVPGELFSVNPVTARGVPGCSPATSAWSAFSRASAGPFVMVLVGATIVGSMATVWHGVVNPPRPGKLRDWRYEDQDLRYGQGAEMGRFLLGSTVVMLFPQGTLELQSRMGAGAGNPHGRNYGPSDGRADRLTGVSRRLIARSAGVVVCQPGRRWPAMCELVTKHFRFAFYPP
jgi:phosphatidylserine decarboxylase precursor